MLSSPQSISDPTTEQQQFFMAAMNGDLPTVKSLLEDKLKNIDPNQKFTEKGGFALFVAAQEGHFNVVNYLLSLSTIDINLKTTCNDMSALHIAANNGHVDVVKVLSEDKKIDIDIMDKNLRLTPMHVAKNIEMVKLLLKARANPNMKDKAGNSVLSSAIIAEKYDIVQLLDGYEKSIHVTLIYFIKLLGLKSNKEGICSGFADIATILVLSGKMSKEKLYEMLFTLKNMKVVDFLGMQAFHEARIKQVEEKVLSMFNVESMNELGEQEQLHYHKRVREKLIQYRKMSSKEEQKKEIFYLDSVILLSAISLKFHEKNEYEYLLEGNRPLQGQEFSVITRMIQTEALEKKGGAVDLYSAASAFNNKQELSSYFFAFRNRIKEIKEIQDAINFTLHFAFESRSPGHAISVFFDPIDDTWELMDINHMPDRPEEIKKIVLPGSGDIALNISDGLFSTNGKIVFYATITTTKQESYLVKPAIVQWQRDIMSLQAITKKKIKALNDMQYLWLYVAAEHGDAQSVEKLINNGVIIHGQVYKKIGRTPLYIAAAYGHLSVVNILLSQPGINFDEQEKEYKNTPLIIAARYGYTDIVKVLLSAKAKPNIKNASGNTALLIAANGGYSDITKLLLETKNIDIEPIADSGVSLLKLIVRKNLFDALQVFIRKHAIKVDPNEHVNGTTALINAIILGHTKIVDALLSATFKTKMNLDRQEEEMFSPLHFAVFKANQQPMKQGVYVSNPAWIIIQLLISAGADINRVDHNGKKLIDYAKEHVKQFVLRTLDKYQLHNKRMKHHHLSAKPMVSILMQSSSLFKKLQDDFLINNRYYSSQLQREYDKNYGVTLSADTFRSALKNS